MSDGKMRLRHSPTSPFVRKVLSFAYECGLEERIEIVPTKTWDPTTDLPADNPLGKIPVLITSDGTFIGSLFCCKYLDTLHNAAKLIPPASADEWPAMKSYYLADGILEAAVAAVTESNQRPEEMVYRPFLERQRGKIERTLGVLEATLLPMTEPVSLWALTLGCALGYLDFRLPHIDWRAGHPRIDAFYGTIMQRPSLLATRPPASVQPIGTPL